MHFYWDYQEMILQSIHFIQIIMLRSFNEELLRKLKDQELPT
jgi:hypothetical protein